MEKDARVFELRLQAEMAILNDEPRAALNYFSELIQIDQADWEAYRGRAGVHGFLKDFEAAVTDLSTAIKLQPDEAVNEARVGA